MCVCLLSEKLQEMVACANLVHVGGRRRKDATDDIPLAGNHFHAFLEHCIHLFCTAGCVSVRPHAGFPFLQWYHATISVILFLCLHSV